MFTFTIFIPQKNINAEKYLRGIETIKQTYPDLVVIDSWGDCPIKQNWNIRQSVDNLRVWTLSQHDSALYVDPDVAFPKGQLIFDSAKPFVSQVKGTPQSFVMGHDGHPEYFANGLKWREENQMTGWWLIDYMQSTIDEINLIPEELIIHHGFTQNRIA